MLFGEFREDSSNGLSTSVLIVRRKGCIGKRCVPELFSDVVHFAFNAIGLGVRRSDDLFGGESSIEFQFQLFRKLFFSNSPSSLGARKDFFFEKSFEFLECRRCISARGL